MEAPPPEIYGPLDRVGHVMGMPIGIEILDPEVAIGALDEVFDWFRWMDATFSTYKSDSEVSRLNRGELTVADTHPEVRAVLERCEELHEETDGYFDIRAPFLRGVIFNPHTGGPPTGVVSVTLTGPDLGTADAYATAIFAMGQDGPAWEDSSVDIASTIPPPASRA